MRKCTLLNLRSHKSPHFPKPDTTALTSGPGAVGAPGIPVLKVTGLNSRVGHSYFISIVHNTTNPLHYVMYLLCSYLHFLSFSVIKPSLHHFCRVFHNLSLSLLYISFHHIYLFFISPISLQFFVSYLSYPHYPALLFLFARFLYLFQPGEIYLRLLENRVGMWFPIHQGWCG